MAFNPDAFLAESSASPTGFDPDKFLAQPVSAEERGKAQIEANKAEQEQYGTPQQQAVAGAEALGRAATFGGSSYIEKKLGVPVEDIRAREHANPAAAAVGTIAGLANPFSPEGAILSKVGSTIAAPIIERGVLSGMTKGAVKLAAENALYQTGDETSKMILEDPNQSIGSAISNVGLAAVLGGVAGGGLGAVSPLWKATLGSKASQLASDFKGRYLEHMNNPDPVGAFTEEMSNYHKGISDIASEVYGPVGLKAQEVSKLMPKEITPKIASQVEEINAKAESALQDMAKKAVPDRYINKFKSELDKFQGSVSSPDVTPEQVFNAAQDFKQTLQGYSKGNYGPFAVPSYHEAYDFLNTTKNLGHDIRTALEETSTWGKAAERQQAINKAFKQYLPTLQDFEKKFTTLIAGERVIDPGKVNTYLNQLGKPNAEVKQTMLKNFLDASEKYKQVIADTHANLGVDSPVQHTPMNKMLESLNEQSHGAQLADLFIKHQNGLLGKVGGGLLGGAAGLLTHIPGAGAIGTIIGEHALGPFMGSLLPALAKSIVEKDISGVGLKASSEYVSNIVKGQKLANRAVKSIFQQGVDALPESKRPTVESRKKLANSLEQYKTQPEKIADTGGDVGQYLPNHAVEMGALVSHAVDFLTRIKPTNPPKAPLDPVLPVSTAVQAQYDRALDIAQQPLIVLDSVKNGTLTSHDIIALQMLYPGFYQGLKTKVMLDMTDQVAKGESIPYKTRLGLSLFLGQPLDSTMKPESIMGAQPTPQQGPPQSPQQTPRKMGSQASNSLIKGAKTYQTGLQARENMQSTQKA